MTRLWLIAYALGICAALWLHHPVPLLIPILGALACLLLRRHRSATAWWLLLGVTLGLYLAGHQPPGNAPHSIASLAGPEEVTLLGRVAQSTNHASGGQQLDLEQLQTPKDGKPQSLSGRLRLTLKQAQQSYPPGNWLQFRCRLKQPRRFGIPGEFNRPLYLASLGIFATAYLDNDRGMISLPYPGSPGVATRIRRLRAYLGQQLADDFSPERGALLRALLLGDKSGLDDGQRQTLSLGGIAHLFSVSGLHLGLVAGFCCLLGGLLYRRSSHPLNWQPAGRVLPLLVIPLLWGYLLLTGEALATQRALLMFSCGALLLFWRRQSSPLNLLTAACLILLLLQPLALFSPSFQFSVAGLAGILLLVPRWLPRWQQLPTLLRFPLGLMAASLAATLTTFPLSLIYFHQGNLAAPVVNLLAVPVAGLVALPLGLLGILLLAVGLPGAQWLLQLSGWLLEQLVHLTEKLLAVPLLTGISFSPSLVQLIVIGLLLTLLLLPWRRGQPSRQLRWLCLTTALLLLLLPNRQTDDLRVTSLSVGQGEATLVSLGSRHLLIDGGGFYDSSFDVGRRLLAPALGRLGVSAPNTIILSHNHPDHSLGLEYLLSQTDNPQLLTTVARDELPYRPELLERLKLNRPAPGWTPLYRDDRAELQLFVPDQQAANLNDRSLVLYARYGDDGLLLSGDLASDGVTQLLEQPPPGPVTLLKLPHHGSRYSHSERLLDQLHPVQAFVSAGRDNRFGLPSPAVVKALAERSIPLWRTDLDGSLQFRSQGSGWQARSFENWLFH